MSGLRERYQSQIPARYQWRAHITIDFTLAFAVIVFAAVRIESIAGWELLALPIGFLTANVVEYFFHKTWMHRPWPPRFIYERHGVIHHSYFTHASMGMDSMRDLRWVLFPAFSVPLLVLAMIPIAMGVGALVSTNAGWLTLMVTASYYAMYEFLHTAYHMPPTSWLGRRRAIAFLRQVHRTHHDPKLMTSANFNVTFPLTDALLGTWVREPISEQRVDEAAVDAPAHR